MSNDQSTNESNANNVSDWAKNAENAAKRAEAEVDKLKKEAQDQLNAGKGKYNNPDDK